MSPTGIHHRFVLVRAPAKLNLHLEILGRRPDGFHELETVMAAVSLCDSVRFQEAAPTRTEVRCLHSAKLKAAGCEVPSGPRNIAFQSLEQIRQQASGRTADRLPGAIVDIFKRIPDRAGLGGGSSDAAAVIAAARHAWRVSTDLADVARMAAAVGSDVPFFLEPGISLCRGRGEVVLPLRRSAPLWFVIVKPAGGLSTRDVYERLTLPAETRGSGEICSAIEAGTPREIGRLMFNRLQPVAEPLAPDIRRAAAEFRRLDCCGHQMSGSGSAYFGLFADRVSARRGEQILRARLPGWFIASCHSLARQLPNLEPSSHEQEAYREYH